MNGRQLESRDVLIIVLRQMLRRAARLAAPTFRWHDAAEPTASLAKATCDHLAVDLTDAVTAAVHMSERNEARSMQDRLDQDRLPRAAVTRMREVMFRFQPTKSLALFLGGAESASKIAHIRSMKSHDRALLKVLPGSVTAHIADKAMAEIGAQRNIAPEVVLAGSCTGGSAETKIAAWMNDMAARPEVTPADSFVIVGQPSATSLLLSATPFHNITLATGVDARVPTSVPRRLHFTRILDMLGAASWLKERHHDLARLRMDLVLLQLMADGSPGAGLPPVPGAELVIPIYVDATIKRNGGAFLCRDESGCKIAVNASTLASLVEKASAPSSTGQSGNAEAYIELLLQTHHALCHGTVAHATWAPAVPLSTPSLFQVVQYLRSRGAHDISAQRNAAPLFTAAQYYCLTAPDKENLAAAIASYMADDEDLRRRHARWAMDAAVAIVAADVAEAVRLSQHALMTAYQANPSHPALAFTPAKCTITKKNTTKPQVFSVALGQRSQLEETRKVLNARTNVGQVVLSRSPVCPIVTWDNGQWKTVDGIQLPKPPQAPTTLSVINWNVLFDRFSGQDTPMGKKGIEWHTKTRYIATSRVLEEQDADVIILQEVEVPLWQYLSKQPWVKNNYHFNCDSTSDLIRPRGIMTMLNKRVRPLFVGGCLLEKSVMTRVDIGVGPDQATPMGFHGVHVLAPYHKPELLEVRTLQLNTMEQHLHPAKADFEKVICIDTNDHPRNFYVMPSEIGFTDAWRDVKGPAKSPGELHDREGWTLSPRNTFCKLMCEKEFFGRSDRIYTRSKLFRNVAAELIGTSSVADILGSETPLDCPDYLFCSDHFGVKITMTATWPGAT